jgi:hypothetical protein
MQCGLVRMYWHIAPTSAYSENGGSRFPSNTGKYLDHNISLSYPDAGGNMLCWNNDEYLPDYTASQSSALKTEAVNIH